MRPLPSTIERLQIPERFSPSHLAKGLSCALRLIAASDPQVGARRLPSGPEAHLGSLLHQLIENSSRGLIEVGLDPELSIEREFDRLLLEWSVEHGGNEETARFSDLRSAFSRREWQDRTWVALSKAPGIAARTFKGRLPVSRAGGEGEGGARFRSYADLPAEGAWAEVWVESQRWRVGGKMDFVEKRPPNLVLIKDYKSGRIMDSEGVLESIKVQLHAYALAVLDHDPSTQIRLVIEKGEPFEVAFEFDEFARKIDEFLDKYPQGAELPAASLAANVGPGVCAHCSIRHLCPAYRSEAPLLWKSGSKDGHMPPDVWGTLVAEDRREGESDLTIRDPTGQERLVRGVEHSRHGLAGPLKAHSELWIFNLEANSPRMLDGRWVHPTALHDLKRGGRRSRAAMASRLFVANPQSSA